MAVAVSPIVLLSLLLLLLAATAHTRQTNPGPGPGPGHHRQSAPTTYPHHPFVVEGGGGVEAAAHQAHGQEAGCKRHHWQACFYTRTDCLEILGGGGVRRECYDESSAPPGRCRPFENFASVRVDTQWCEVSLYRDGGCRELLQGSDTILGPWEEFCWKKLTTDPAWKESRLRYQYLRFSGSWNVSCPDWPPRGTCPPKIDCPVGCVRGQYQRNATLQGDRTTSEGGDVIDAK